MITVIPAIDIINGECVRLTQGDYDRKTVYYSDPSDIAAKYAQAGFIRLHMVDLDGAKASFPQNLKVLERTAARTKMDIQYGGGIKSREALRAVFEHGASRAICGSIAVTEPDMFCQWLAEFGPDRIILGADIKNGMIATHGWLESSRLSVEELIDRFNADGLSQVICTDISKDGMLKGPSFGLYRDLQHEFPDLDITVSGGIGSMEDIMELDKMGLQSVIVGKALYEGNITMEELAGCLQKE